MDGVVFHHVELGSLALRLAPTSVEWTYNLNTSIIDTLGGQVLQLLSINYDKLLISGRFGREGPHGRDKNKKGLQARKTNEYWDYKKQGDYLIGLSQMTEYFTQYFEKASQGGRSFGKFDQTPMTVRYKGGQNVDKQEQQWLIYPVSFPSFKRSNEDFAPEWRIECYIEEADSNIKDFDASKELARLRNGVGYKQFNPFSDPWGEELKNQPIETVQRIIDDQQDIMFDYWGKLAPNLTAGQENILMQIGASSSILAKEIGASNTALSVQTTQQESTAQSKVKAKGIHGTK